MLSQWDETIIRALREDKPTVDLTSEWIFDDDAVSKAKLIAKEKGVLSGLAVLVRTFECVDTRHEVVCHFSDGDLIVTGDVIAEIKGPTKSMLYAERTALNFLQRMSGIATATRAYVEAVNGYGVKIVDTRKTAPGLRIFDKMAVRTGGGFNHRFTLSDGVLIKDNHISAAGGVREAVERTRAAAPHTVKIEIEVESLQMLEEAIEAGADVVMLDNMTTEMMKKAVSMSGGRVLLEASGNMTLGRVKEVAMTGVDLISVGELTHSVKAMDISLKFG